jgi:hypothetical protein
MKPQELIELANKAIARWSDPKLPKLPGTPVVNVVALKLEEEIELHPQVIGTYLGTTGRGKYVYSVPAHAIIENL